MLFLWGQMKCLWFEKAAIDQVNIKPVEEEEANRICYRLA